MESNSGCFPIIIITIVTFLLISKCNGNLDKWVGSVNSRTELMESHVGDTLMLAGDSLVVTSYSLISNDYTLSNGAKVARDLVENRPVIDTVIIKNDVAVEDTVVEESNYDDDDEEYYKKYDDYYKNH